MVDPAKLFPPPAEVLPHKGDMILLHSILTHCEEKTEVLIQVGDSPFFVVNNNYVPAWVGLEYMAQAIAAHAGLLRRRSGLEPRLGFLIGTRLLELRCEQFLVGCRLRTTAKVKWFEGEMAIFECSIYEFSSDRLLAKGDLNVYQPPDNFTVKV